MSTPIPVDQVSITALGSMAGDTGNADTVDRTVSSSSIPYIAGSSLGSDDTAHRSISDLTAISKLLGNPSAPVPLQTARFSCSAGGSISLNATAEGNLPPRASSVHSAALLPQKINASIPIQSKELERSSPTIKREQRNEIPRFTMSRFQSFRVPDQSPQPVNTSEPGWGLPLKPVVKVEPLPDQALYPSFSYGQITGSGSRSWATTRRSHKRAAGHDASSSQDERILQAKRPRASTPRKLEAKMSIKQAQTLRGKCEGRISPGRCINTPKNGTDLCGPCKKRRMDTENTSNANLQPPMREKGKKSQPTQKKSDPWGPSINPLNTYASRSRSIPSHPYGAGTLLAYDNQGPSSAYPTTYGQPQFGGALQNSFFEGPRSEGPEKTVQAMLPMAAKVVAVDAMTPKVGTIAKTVPSIGAHSSPQSLPMKTITVGGIIAPDPENTASEDYKKLFMCYPDISPNQIVRAMEEGNHIYRAAMSILRDRYGDPKVILDSNEDLAMEDMPTNVSQPQNFSNLFSAADLQPTTSLQHDVIVNQVLSGLCHRFLAASFAAESNHEKLLWFRFSGMFRPISTTSEGEALYTEPQLTQQLLKEQVGVKKLCEELLQNGHILSQTCKSKDAEISLLQAIVGELERSCKSKDMEISRLEAQVRELKPETSGKKVFFFDDVL